MGNVSEMSVNVGYFVVGLLDILNQRQTLQSWSKLPEGPDAGAKLIGLMGPTVGTVVEVRRLFVQYVHEFNSESLSEEQLATLPAPQRAEFEEIRRTVFGIQTFSDSVALFAPIHHLRQIPVLRDVFCILSGLGYLQVMLLAGKVVVRGAVEMGSAARLSENEIYGPVLASAHHLESEIADYPRVVVGRELVAFLQSITTEPAADPLWQFSKSIATHCLGMIYLDEDGIYAVDGVGLAFETVDQEPSNKDAIVRARAFVQEELLRFQQEGNQKLALRYARLRRCFDRHATKLGACAIPQPKSA
jgi:hypothetical protein